MPGETIRILTHNVYWFQGFPSRWGEERAAAEVPEVLSALTQLYADAAPDVLCLQEVHRPDLAEALARKLGMTTWLHAPGGRRPDYGAVILTRLPSQLENRTVIDGHRHERVHLRASLSRTGGESELAAVHLPSNRFVESAAAGDDARIEELERALDDPRPHLVVGDMNCRPDSTPYRFMVDHGYVDVAVESGRDRLEHRVDYMWLEAGWEKRLVSFSVLDSGPFNRVEPAGDPWQLSDHPPLLMEMR